MQNAYIQDAYFVTGASTGIGRCVTERLAALGHRVFATARQESDLESLGQLESVIPVPLDVRRAGEIEAAVRQVRAAGGRLVGLVNNAGIGGIGPFVSWTDEELDDIFAVNALGPVRVSRALLPLLLESGGRVVNIGSQGGSISKKLFGPYTMTKHALEAFTTALAEEVEPFGVRVSIVQPGGVITAIGQNSVERDLARFRRAPAPFDAEAKAIAAAIAETIEPGEEARTDSDEDETNRKPSPPDLVADAVLHALLDPAPRRRYLVGTRWEGNRVIDTLLERLADANACPSLGLTTEEMARRLGEALAARRP